MTTEECQRRAADCAENAAISADSSIALEFLTLAAHWRAMAVRQIFLGSADRPVAFQDGLTIRHDARPSGD